MLRTYGSTSTTTRLSYNHFHTSTIRQATNRKQIARSARKLNLAKREERQRQLEANRPHVVLGTRPNDHTSWPNCDLAKVIIDRETLAKSIEQPMPMARHPPPPENIWLPNNLGHGLGDEEKKLLFQNLPALSMETDVLRERQMVGGIEEWSRARLASAEQKEQAKANTLARLLDLRNANARGIAYENRKQIIAAFSGADNPFDTGRPEVQAALLTYKIRNLWSHLMSFKRDIANRRSLRKLVHQRAKILKYLRRTDRDRYDVVLSQLALEPGSVEGELVV